MCNGGMKLVVEDGPRACPRCKIELNINQFQDHDIDTCPKCEGMWIEPEVFRAMTTEFDVYNDKSANPDYQRPSLPGSESYMPCACCSQLMTKKQFKRISGVMIDLCVHCGVWLDKDELTNIRNFIASGGLDSAQDRQFDRFSSETTQALDKLDTRLSDLEYMDKVMNMYSPRYWFHRFTR